MKTLLALVCSVVVVTLGSAQSATPAPAPSTGTAPSTEAAPDAAPKTPPVAPPVRIAPPKQTTDKPDAKKAETAKKAPEPKKKEEPKIEGITVSRGERGFIGVEIVNSTFKITFYDTKKKKIAPDVARAALRWDPKYKVGSERLVLNPDGDGKSLSSPKSIRPPYNFKLFITLIKEAKEATESQDVAGETHVIDFKG